MIYKSPRLRRFQPILLVVILAVLIAPGLQAVDGLPSNDFITYYQAGLKARTGISLYVDDDVRNRLTSPPLMAFAFIPLSFLTLEKAYWVWYFASLVSLGLCLVLLHVLFRRILGDFDWWGAAIAVVLLSRFILNHLQRGQVNLAVMVVVLAGLALFEYRNKVPAGVCFGLAAALKIFPIFFLFYWLRKKEWVLATVMCTSLVLFTVLPASGYGFEKLATDLTVWVEGVAIPTSTGDLPPDFFSPHAPYNLQNQSLFAAVIRICSSTPKTGNHETNIVSLQSPAVEMVAVGVVLAFVGLTLFGQVRSTSSGMVRLLEYSQIFILMLVAVPLVWKANFVLLLFPYVLWLTARGSRRTTITILAVAAGLQYVPKLVPSRVNDLLYMASILTVSALVIWLGNSLSIAEATRGEQRST